LLAWQHPIMSQDATAPPDEANLREAAIAHLARYASTRMGLKRVLERRVDNWARRARRTGDREAIGEQVRAAKAMIEPIVERLAKAGAVDDLNFAATRSLSLTRAGRSARAVQAHLAAKGVPAEIARETAPVDPEREFGACLVAAKKRRLGPFGTAADATARAREMAALARAGFGERTAREVFRLSREEAEERVIQFRDQLE
jgi:regulatory protein